MICSVNTNHSRSRRLVPSQLRQQLTGRGRRTIQSGPFLDMISVLCGAPYNWLWSSCLVHESSSSSNSDFVSLISSFITGAHTAESREHRERNTGRNIGIVYMQSFLQLSPIF